MVPPMRATTRISLPLLATSFFLVFLAASLAHAAVVDSQLDDSAQATEPPLTDYYSSYNVHGFVPNYLAVGYTPSQALSINGVHFRVNTSGGQDYICPSSAAFIRYVGTTTPPTNWSQGVTIGTINLLGVTTAPGPNGDCYYETRNQYDQDTSLSVYPGYYYVFFFSTAEASSTLNWVSMSGKPYASMTSTSLFGYRPSSTDQYVWGTTGLDSAYFELFDTVPLVAPSSPPPTTCTSSATCVSNVMFLPGIEGSRLYIPDGQGGEKKLWEPGSDADATQLAMTTSGTSIRDDIYTRDVIDNAYLPVLGNVYESFIDQINGMVTSGIMNDWSAIPYDWRLTPDQILNSGAQTTSGNISYLTATSSPYVIQELKHLAATSKTGKVTIIAHSNGGLVAKQLIEELGPDAVDLVDKVIFVAVPQTGTPETVGALLNGYDQGLPTPFIPYALSAGAARTLAQNMPMTYNLLPSASYFSQVSTPVVTFNNDPLLAGFRARYGTAINSENSLYTFVTDSWRSASSTTQNLNYPIVGNTTLFNSAETLHTDLDAWTPPSGITLYQIAGWGEKTLSQIQYNQGISTHCTIFLTSCTTTPEIEYSPQVVLDGDGTVVTPSALWTSTTTGAVDYWLNLQAYNGFTGITNHGDILEVPQLRTLIQNIITNGDDSTLPQYISTSTPINSNPQTELDFILHSPLSLDVYDDKGNHTGISTTTGQLEENIPGSSYIRFGEVQFVSVPTSIHTHLAMKGYASGSFTLDINQVNGDTIVASTTFAGIPSATSTIATMNIPSGGLAGIQPLVVDENADGHPDITLTPKLDATVMLDTTPPITTLVATGTKGTNGWYTSNVALTFNATDTGSGVSKTFFSIDGSATSTGKTASLTAEGTHIVRYYSIDNSGNQEPLNVVTIKIDKTPPEANIVVSTSNKDLLITGLDALSSTTVTKTTTSTNITDQAGNSTKLVFQKTFSGAFLTLAKLASIQYGTSTPIKLPTSFVYLWNLSTNPPTLLSQTITADNTYLIEAAYNKQKNQSTIIVLKKNAPIQTKVLTGLVPIQLTTNKGALGYSW